MAGWLWPGDLGGPRAPEQVRARLELQARQLDRDRFCMWWWRERDTGEPVGQVGLNRTDVLGEAAVEVGWSISPRHWNRGFATEAARASLAWGFEEVGLDEIVAFALLENLASHRVIEKLGMRYRRDFERYGLPHGLYRLRRADWRRRVGAVRD